MKTQVKSTVKTGRPRNPRKVLDNLTFNEGMELLGQTISRGRPRRELYNIDGLAGFECIECHEKYPLKRFSLLNAEKFYFSSTCNICWGKHVKENWSDKDPIAKRAQMIKNKAQKGNIPCDSNLEMLIRQMWSRFPDGAVRCSYTDVPLVTDENQSHHDHYWTVDRVFPEQGYVKGNIALCANLTNRMKQQMNVDEYLTHCLWALDTFVNKGISAFKQEIGR